MTLAVCLLLDRRGDTAIRKVWHRLEEAGVGTLATHTHGRHVPHLTWAAVPGHDVAPVVAALADLPDWEPVTLHFDALGTFRRSRCWLGPAVVPELVARQREVVAGLVGAGAEVHRNYQDGAWIPHLTLAPRLKLSDLPTVARVVYDVLPITATGTATAVIDTSNGAVHQLPSG
jgi:hypothetical protein